jgi:glycosyltransferase involved in cell wall biosynthesis
MFGLYAVKKNSVIILHSGESSTGGIANATIYYALALQAAGYRAEIWTPVQGLADRCEKFAIPVFRHDWLESAGLSLFSPKIAAKALRARRNAAAVMHQGSKLWFFGLVWLRGVSQSVVFHNEKIGGRRLFKRWLALSQARGAELAAFASSRGLAKQVCIIRNGPLPSPSKTGPRPEAIKTIGFLGNFGRKKAIDMLLLAFAELVKRGHNIRLVLAGDGRDRLVYNRLAESLGVADRILWPGWLSDTQAFFDTIDLFVLPSRDEPFGIVITEAIQAALPVVATATKGPMDLVIHGKTGWLVRPDDPAALADAIDDLIRNSDRAQAFGANGYQRFLCCYSPKVVGELLAEALALPPLTGNEEHMAEIAALP